MDELSRMRKECAAFFDTLWTDEQKTIVFGEGCTQEPPLMLIGEAPGEQEALQGKPFVGKAGKNLTEFLEVLGMARTDLYVTNVVKIRPTKQSQAGRIVNRPPTREEIELFLPWLKREIAIVKPKALVTLGNVALHAFVPRSETIGDCHGRWRMAAVQPPKDAAFTLPLFALYHPASVIYNRSLLDTYRADLATLRQTLTLPPVTFESQN